MIAGKVIAITGASSGIGEATALHLAERGARIVLGGRDDGKLQALTGRIRAAGGEVACLSIDVTRRGDLEAFVALACERFSRLDVLISNAGVMPIGPLQDLAVDDWVQMVDVNVKGVLFGIAAALPVFRRQGAGHFIQTGSTAARKTVPSQAVYSGTKAAVLAISDGLRQEMVKQVRVTVITPGFTATGFVEYLKDPALKAQMERSRDEIAMAPRTVALAVAYAIDQPDDVDVAEIIIRSTAQA